MDSKLKCTFVLPEGSEMNGGSSGIPSTIGSSPLIKSAEPSSPKVSEFDASDTYRVTGGSRTLVGVTDF